jgi:MSHA pilin protein MshC
MQMQGRYRNGFTLIELISVVVLLSILGVVALSRLNNLHGFDSRAFYFDTVNALRYAQKLAISTGCRVQATISSNSYALFQGAPGCTDTTYTLPVANPANRTTDYTGTAPAGLTITSTASLPLSVQFTPQSTLVNLAADTTFNIDGRQFTLYRLTGLVDAQ